MTSRHRKQVIVNKVWIKVTAMLTFWMVRLSFMVRGTRKFTQLTLHLTRNEVKKRSSDKILDRPKIFWKPDQGLYCGATDILPPWPNFIAYFSITLMCPKVKSSVMIFSQKLVHLLGKAKYEKLPVVDLKFVQFFLINNSTGMLGAKLWGTDGYYGSGNFFIRPNQSTTERS